MGDRYTGGMNLMDAAVLATVTAMGATVIRLDRDDEFARIDKLHRADDLVERLSILDMIAGPEPALRPTRLGDWSRSRVTHTFSPELVSKRRARRLKGKARG